MKKDTKTKQYTRDPVIFADAFNQHFHKGRKVIKAEELQEMDSTEVVYFTDVLDKALSQQRIRDVKKKWIFIRDRKNVYCLLAIKNQSDIHYAMPLKVALCDILQLADQWNAIKTKHGREEDNAPSKAEFISGFWKKDKLVPVVTLVIFYSPDEWAGPRSLREMYENCDNRVMSKALDYKNNLIEPYRLSDRECLTLEQAMEALKVSDEYKDFVRANIR